MSQQSTRSHHWLGLLAARLAPLVLILLLAASRGSSRSPAAALTELSGRTMGTTYSVRFVPTPAAPEASSLAAAIQTLLDDLEQKMSTYRDDSELMRFNASATSAWVPLSADLYRVLEEALFWSRKTDGAFDVSVGALVNLWGFGPMPGRFALPPAAEIDKARRDVGYSLLELRASPPALRKRRPQVFLDLSGIAKGYAVDRVAGLLRASGVTDCLVEIGGELKGIGRNPNGQAWSVAVEDPAGGPGRHHLALSGLAVATSGNYRQFISHDGRHFSHILDPRSGHPVSHNLASVTVIHPSALTADALATALISLGPEPGYELARREQLAAFFLERDRDGVVERMTPWFRSHLQYREARAHD